MAQVTRRKFAKILKDYRERRRFTQEEAAAKLGVSVRTLQNWEIARNMPRGFGLAALLKVIAPK
ncbi:MAG: helix-turn-helix transcriptional regulator [Chthoniobacterales bacterium]|nr:helix-turn-helix transcriptional regulator [Chthoniobacterales bacterium]